jgi:sugar-specific transcriptional regulator TrmB
MSLTRILKTLTSFGFTKAEAEVYIYLAKKGPQKDRDLTSVFKMTELELCSALKSLQSRGVVTAAVEKSALFSAVAFEKIFALFVKANLEQAYAIQETKEELLATWRSMTEQDT